MPGVEASDVPSLTEDQFRGGLLDSLPYLFLGHMHDLLEIHVVETGVDQHLKSGLEQVVLGLVVLGYEGLPEVELVLVLQLGRVLRDDGVVPLGLVDFLSLYEPVVGVADGKCSCCCHFLSPW